MKYMLHWLREMEGLEASASLGDIRVVVVSN